MTGGGISVESGEGVTASGGAMCLGSANGGANGVGGLLAFSSGSSKGGNSGALLLGSGGATSGRGGAARIGAGRGTSGSGAALSLDSGRSSTFTGGAVRVPIATGPLASFGDGLILAVPPFYASLSWRGQLLNAYARAFALGPPTRRIATPLLGAGTRGAPDAILSHRNGGQRELHTNPPRRSDARKG